MPFLTILLVNDFITSPDILGREGDIESDRVCPNYLQNCSDFLFTAVSIEGNHYLDWQSNLKDTSESLIVSHLLPTEYFNASWSITEVSWSTPEFSRVFPGVS